MSRQRGQITVLVLLLSLLGLAASLSLASRSLSDLRQATYVDSGTKALAAAEAGLQYASTLAGADCSPHELVGAGTLSLWGIKSVSYTTCAVTKTSITVPGVAVDDVVQFDLTGASSNLKAMDVSWLGDASVEIEVLDSDDTLRRYAYNAVGQSRSNGFAAAMPGSNCSTADCDPSFATGSCIGPGEICYKQDCGNGNVKAKLVRIKPLYQSAPINICGRFAGNSGNGFGTQYYQVTVTATTLNGTVRRIQADRFPPGLPAIFDNVLYSGGSLAK